MNAFIIEEIPLSQAEIDQIRTTLATAGYSLLREVIAAQVCKACLSYMDASLYDTDSAQDQVIISKAKARKFEHAMEVLDQIAGNMDEWARIKLDQRR